MLVSIPSTPTTVLLFPLVIVPVSRDEETTPAGSVAIADTKTEFAPGDVVAADASGARERHAAMERGTDQALRIFMARSFCCALGDAASGRNPMFRPRRLLLGSPRWR